jgi:hypothetical protein
MNDKMSDTSGVICELPVVEVPFVNEECGDSMWEEVLAAREAS